MSRGNNIYVVFAKSFGDSVVWHNRDKKNGRVESGFGKAFGELFSRQ